MILLNGVSGFNHSPIVDGEQFKRTCFFIIQKHRGRVLEFVKPEIVTNYYKVKVQVCDKQLYMLLNSTYPFLAFATSVTLGEITFVENNQLAKWFSPYYRILRESELSESLIVKERKGKTVVENDNELNEAELYNIKFWRPERVGEIVFNCWD